MEKDNKKTKKNKVVFNIVLLIMAYIFSTCLPNLFLIGTNAFKLDVFCYQLNGYQDRLTKDKDTAPYIKIKQSNRNVLYNDLFEQFYYSLDCGSVRQYMDNNCFIENENNNSINVSLFSQRAMSIKESSMVFSEENEGYLVDYGLFGAYFSDPELGTRGYIGKHFEECDSFIYISDKLADKLLEKHGLTPTRDNYLRLVTEKQLAVLEVSIDGENIIKLSINNILFSKERDAKRISQFNECFGLIEFAYVSNLVEPVIELDFKSYSYFKKSVLKKIDSLGYTTDNTELSFYTYDISDKQYKNNEILNSKYIEYSNSESSIIFTVLYFSTSVLFLCLFGIFTFFKCRTRKVAYCLLLFEFLLLCLYSIICTFAYTYYIFAILGLIAFVLTVIMKGGILKEDVKKVSFVQQNLANTIIYEIQI